MLPWVQTFLGAVSFLVVYKFLLRRRNLDHIPTVGYSSPFLCVFTAIKYIFAARDILEEGYRLYPNGIFKFWTLDGWSIVVNDTQMIEDIRRSTEEQLHGMSATAGYFGFRYTLGHQLLDNPFHIDVIRTAMTRNIASRYQDIHEAVERAYLDAIPSESKEWTALGAYKLQVDVITKVSCRYFFGEPLCEDPEFRSLCERATLELFKGRFLRIFPSFMKPLGVGLITDVYGLRSKMENYLRPIVAHRQEQQRLHGVDWPGKPNDLISWLMDGARATTGEITLEDLASRVVFTCFGAIHTSSGTFTAALYQLALNPQDAQEIREEVETVIKAEGWSKASIGKMHKMDSYLRESLRLHFMGLLSLGREVMQDFTFSDGTFLPKHVAGISVNIYARHRDEVMYSEPHKFDGFRFVPKAGSTASQPLVVNPTLEYISFGIGRPACPGRFFAITELKTMLAHIVTNYDIKLEQDTYPKKMIVEANSIPNMTAKILFRRRTPS